MSDKGTASERRGTGLLPAGIVIALLVAVAGYMTLRDNAQLDETEVTSVVTPAAPTVAEAVTEPEDSETQPKTAPQDEVTDLEATPAEGEEAPEADVAAAQAPSVDEVRVDDAGTMVVAGRGAPGSQVDVLLDGERVTTAQVDDSGAFAALTTLPQDDGARSLTLRSGEGSAAVDSKEEIILAPIASAPATVEDQKTEVEEVETASLEAGTRKDELLAGPSVAQPSVAQPSDEAGAAATEGTKTPEPNTSPAEVATLTEEAAAPEKSDGAAQTTAPAPRKTPTDAGPSGSAEETADQGEQIAILRSDEQGVTLVQPALPPSDSVALDTIGYNDEGVVQLGGRASGAAAEIRVYLDNRPVALLPVDAEGRWRGIVPGVDPGIYRLRLDALTADGRVASRIETPFKREAPSVLAAAASETDDAGTVRAITVQAGDTLWAIARDRYGEGLLYVQVFEANRKAIVDPDLIYPGQVFDLPGE